ncbi:hypothetical protein M758_1G041500 [Ceratodon purpureus]|nr:hypothetical protein M758_1G041200 [Ceratodon purpureus]KAG0628634.1 hypothetical protein M758_1G041500 [Ceratodon purpureus]
MLSSERRGSSARRGMTVLGKIPAVPKPINLPSQRLENRGLDPNVEIVPRGSVSWGAAGRSPPTSVNAWGTPSQASSPPSSSGAWGPKAGAAAVGSNSSISGGSTLGGPANIPRPTSGGSGTRPTSGGAGTRPLSAESQAQQSPDSFSSNANSSSAWGARPSSASGVLGQAQPQLAQAQARPRSADITRPNRSLSEFGDQSGSHSPPGNAAWGNRGPPRRLGEEPHQVSRFQLTRTDFPTLGSEKNPDLRPQHSNSAADRGASVETKGAHPEERRPPTPPGPHEEVPPMPPSGGYGHPERGAPDNWRREPAAFQGPPPAAEGNWHRDGPSARPSYGGQGPQPDSWRREAAPSGGPADDNWRRGGVPPVGQYGPPPGPGHYPHEGPGFMHQPRFGPGPAPFGRGAPGPGGYGHHGDMYGNAGPLLRPAGPMHPMRPNMFQGPVPYDGFYGPPGPGYQGMEDPERMMMGMGGGPYGGFPQHRGPPPEAFGRFPHGGMNQGPRHPPNSGLRERERERGEPVREGFHEGENYQKEGSEGPGHKDGRGYNERYSGGPGPGPEGGDNRRGGLHRAAPGGGDGHGQGQRGGSSGHHGGHRDWGAAASSDEPMDFSKPVFEEEVVSAPPSGSGKQSPSPAQRDESSVEEVKREDVKADVNTEKSVVEVETAKDEEKKVVVASKSDTVAAHRSAEVSSTPKSRSEVGDASEGKDQAERKVQNVVDKEVVAKIVTKDGPGKWERGSKRADSHTREVIGPGASGAPAASLRSGQYSSGPKSSILGNAPRNASIPDVAPAPQILQHPSQEKAIAVSAPPAPEAEVPKAVEKGRILRRPESPKVESGSIETGSSGVSDVSATQTASVHEGSGKEGSKPKGKASSHDGEKEWRPKVPIAEASPRPSVAAVAQAPKPAVAPATPGTETTEENATDPEAGPKPGSYDYDAQRAKMKEIAAQRARQLQKEEEERIKEQKAKARAKLEELDRRSTVVPSSTAEEPAVEVPKMSVEVEEVQQVEETPAAEAEPVLQSGSSTGSTKRGVRNEHGKRERDRKANGRKAGAGEAGKAKVNGAPSQASAILPPPIAAAAPLLTTPLPVPEVYGQHANAQREPRHRGRPEKKQLVAKGDDGDRSVPTAGPSIEISPAAANGGWSMDTPLPAQEPESANVSHLTTSSTEGSGSLRKSKNSRNSRNRPRAEAPPMMAESIQFGDIPAYHPIMGGEHPVDPAVGAFHIDVGKDGNSLSNVSLSGDALTGDEGSAVSTNGDASGKRMHRKSHGARRGSGRSERGSQDQRAAEKSHGSDSMVWAPVRSPGAVGGNKGEGAHFNEHQKEESSSAQQQARAKRAEMERYTPKPLQKQQETTDQPAAAPPAHQHAQGVQNQSVQGAVATPTSAGESPRVGSAAENKQVSCADPKSNHDTKPVESGTKGGRSHGSWRQRGSGSERAADSAKEAPVSGPAAANSSGPGPGDSGHPRHRSEQKSGGGHAPSRRNQGASDHLLATPQTTPAAPPPGAAHPAPAPAAAPAAAPAPGSVQVSEREHPADKKLYQPPRPASAPAHRGQDHRVQDYRGQDNRGQDHRGQDYRGQDHRGQDHRGHDHRGQGPHSSEQKGHEQGTAPHSRHSNAPSDRALPSENTGSQQHHRNGGGHHPRGQNVDKDQAYMAPHSQQKPHPTAGTKEPSHPVSRERESQQQQQQQSSRGSSQHSAETGEHGSNHRGRFERDQAARPSSGSQRGQSHWQQTGGSEGFRGAGSRPQATERDLAVTPQFGRMEVSKQQAADSQRPHQAEQAGQQQNKAAQQTAPVAIPSPKVDSGNWEGAGGSPPVMRGRDFSHGGRRGRFGGRSGPRNTEMEHRRDPPSTKQRLVIDATGGAVPSQVGG